MKFPSRFVRTLLAVCLAAFPLSSATAADAARIVFQNGRSIPISAVTVEGDQIVIKDSVDGYSAGQKFPLKSADHIYGDKPTEVNRAIALLLTNKANDALGLLEPVVASQKLTARIPGNFWLEAARAAVLGYAMQGDSAKVTALGKDIADATPQPGIDPFSSLANVLMLPKTTSDADLETAFKALATDDLPTAVCAFASFFRGNVLHGARKNPEALEAYLTVSCLYPAGNRILNAVAEMNAAEYLVTLNRLDEARALFKSSARGGSGTFLAVESNKRLDEIK